MKNKKIKNTIIALTFIIITTIATHSLADVGSFESYDSGSSWSSDSGSSWSSSDYGSSWSSSGSGGDSDGAGIIIWAVIIIGIIIYNKTKGNKNDE